MKETTSVKSPSGRTRRSDRAIRGPLAVRGKEPGFVYRFVNDYDDNVLSYKEGGYEIVQDKDVSIGDKRVNVPGMEGSVKHISVGGGMKAVLMRIPEDLYEQDQAIKEDRIRAQELAIKKEVLNGNGKFEITRD
jgi:hypothetical protein